MTKSKRKLSGASWSSYTIGWILYNQYELIVISFQYRQFIIIAKVGPKLIRHSTLITVENKMDRGGRDFRSQWWAHDCFWFCMPGTGKACSENPIWLAEWLYIMCSWSTATDTIIYMLSLPVTASRPQSHCWVVVTWPTNLCNTYYWSPLQEKAASLSAFPNSLS